MSKIGFFLSELDLIKFSTFSFQFHNFIAALAIRDTPVLWFPR